jgi:hypothetical protein
MLRSCNYARFQAAWNKAAREASDITEIDIHVDY